MGQCFSGPKRGASRRVEVPAARQQETGVTDRVLYPVTSTGGLQVAVSQARCAAGAGGDATPLLVRQTPLHTFIALFEGLGEDRRAVAAFCRTRAFELFQESSVRHPDSPLEALKETAERLDAAIFATDRLSHVVKVSSGASCVLLLVELATQRCYCANVGAAACLISRISGSFNAKQPEGFFLTSEHTTRNREEMVRLQRRAPGEATPPPAAGASGSEAERAAEPTRALGFMAAKAQAGGSGALICEAFAADHKLTGTDQHLVLGSSAFWGLVGPADCALRAHFHEKFARRELDRVAAMAAAAEAAGVPEAAPSPSLQRAANTAEHLLHWSLEKATRRLARLQAERGGSIGAGGAAGWSSNAMPPSVADLLALPLERRAAAPAPAVPAAGGVASSAVEETQQDGAQPAEQQQAQQQQQQQPLIRSDILGDLGVVVVTLRRQDMSMDGGMRDVLMAARAAATAAAEGQQQGDAYMERQSRRRWELIRMVVNFNKAHRRVLLRQWWEAQDALFRRSRTAGVTGKRANLFGSSASPNKLASAAAAVAASRRSGAGAPAVNAAGKAVSGMRSSSSSPTKRAGAGIKAVRPTRE